MSSSLQKLLNELEQLSPEEQWQVIGHLINQLQQRAIVVAKPDQSSGDDAESKWDEQIAEDLETGKLDHLIARAEADIEANNVRDLDIGLYLNLVEEK